MAIILRFGKFKGQSIESVPVSYLEFQLRAARQTIADFAAELERRKQPPAANQPSADRLDRLEKLVLRLVNSHEEGGNSNV